MDNNDLELAQKIKFKFGTATTEPSSIQLDKIKQEIQALQAKGISPSEDDWMEVVRRYCPDAGKNKYMYEEADTADLQTLSDLAAKK